MKALRLLALLVVCALLASSAGAAENRIVAELAREGHWEASEWASHRAMLGKYAPALEMSDWKNGHIVRSSWDGKIVILDFWATWCGPCRKMVPHNNELAQKFAGRGVLFIGACGSGGHGGQDEMAAVAKALGMKYPTANVSDASVRRWNVHYWPTYAIIDRKGKLRAMGVRPDYVEPIVLQLLKETGK